MSLMGLMSTQSWFYLITVSMFFVALHMFVKKCVHCLGKDEQLRIQTMTDLIVVNGPAMKVLLPFTYRSAVVKKAVTLGTTDYVKVKDSLQGSERIERGPKMLFLGGYEEIVNNGKGISLGSTEYVLIE